MRVAGNVDLAKIYRAGRWGWRRQKNNDEKVKKFGAHSVASKITEELRKQKINRKG